MASTGHFTQTQLGVIDASVTLFEAHEAQRRRLEAEQLSALAAALNAAVGPGGAVGCGGTVGSGGTVGPGGAVGPSGGTCPSGGTAPSRGAGPSRATMADRELAYRSLRLEVATALHESERIAERLLATAYLAQEQFPATLEALREGEISLNHVRVVTDEGAPLETGNCEVDSPRRAQYEREVLEFAREETPNRLRPIARRLAAAYSEQTLAERHQEALKRRFVRIVPLEDGMADLVACLSAEDAYAIRDRITQLAKSSLQAEAASCAAEARDPNDGSPLPRSREEARTDVFRDLLLGRKTRDTDKQDQVQARLRPAAWSPSTVIGRRPA